jgi:hypothetical protein
MEGSVNLPILFRLLTFRHAGGKFICRRRFAVYPFPVVSLVLAALPAAVKKIPFKVCHLMLFYQRSNSLLLLKKVEEGRDLYPVLPWLLRAKVPPSRRFREETGSNVEEAANEI